MTLTYTRAGVNIVRRRTAPRTASLATFEDISAAILLSELANHITFPTVSVCLYFPSRRRTYRQNFFHLAKVIFLFAHLLLKLLKLPSTTCLVISHPSLPYNMVQPIVSEPIPIDSAYPI